MMEKVALIWGASGGIGQALVKRILAEGWKVMAVARRTEVLSSLSPWVFQADFSHPGAVQIVVSQIAQEGVEIDWWVYAAGDILSAPISFMDVEQWQRVMNANLNGAFLTLHYSLPLLSASAPLYFIGAITERIQLPGLAAYAAAKAGLEALAEVARKETKRKVVIVRPAAVQTPLWQKVPFRMPSNALSPEEVAEKMWEAFQMGHSGPLDLTP